MRIKVCNTINDAAVLFDMGLLMYKSLSGSVWYKEYVRPSSTKMDVSMIREGHWGYYVDEEEITSCE